MVKSNPERLEMSILYELMQRERIVRCEIVIDDAEAALSDRATRGDVVRQRQGYKTNKIRKQTETLRKYPVALGDHQISHIKKWDKRRIALDLKFDDPFIGRRVMNLIKVIVDKETNLKQDSSSES